MIGVGRKRRIDFTQSGSRDQINRTKRQNDIDDMIDSDDDIDDDDDIEDALSYDGSDDDNDAAREEEKETVDEKRIRLAREYLSKIEGTKGDDDESSDDDGESATSDSEVDEGQAEYDRVGRKLARDRMKSEGMLERKVADKISTYIENCWEESSKHFSSKLEDASAEAQTAVWTQKKYMKLCRGHDLTPTCVALHIPTGSHCYSGSKDNSIFMWDVERQIRTSVIAPPWDPKKSEHTKNSGEVLAMSASDDGRYLAVGGRDATVKIYDVRLNNKGHVKESTPKSNHKKSNGEGISSSVPRNSGGWSPTTTFEGHKGPISALEFRSKSLQLFSGSEDRCIRYYNLDEMIYMETLYGHQAPITGISCNGVRNQTPFSVARDRTARVWKLEEDTHLIYRGGATISNADCIATLNDHWFLTGHDDGNLSLWFKMKKRAISSIPNSHGVNNEMAHGRPVPRGVVSCATLGNSDIAVTGSNDGYLRLWKASTGDRAESRGLEQIQKIPLNGYINDIAVGPKANFCVAAVGQEPRFGRWDRIARAKNRLAIIQLRGQDSTDEENEKDIED